MSGFVVADYIIFFVSVLLSFGIGIFFAYRGRKQQTTEAYLVGNRKLRVIPVALSMAVSFQSGLTMIGIPAETYMFGMVFIWVSLSNMLCLITCMQIIVPLIHPLKLTSFNEYFQLRFQSSVPRLFASIFRILGTMFYLALVLFAPAISIEAVTPFPLWSSIVIAAMTSIIYTAIASSPCFKWCRGREKRLEKINITKINKYHSMGGMKAVIWTDVFQVAVMTFGTVAIMVKSALAVGGIGKVFEIASETGRLNILKPTTNLYDRSSFFMIFGGFFYQISSGLHQMMVQRVSSVPTQRDARWVYVIAAVVITSFATLANFLGLFAFSYFQITGCDPLAGGLISNPNQIMPYLASRILTDVPGLSGLYIAALFSASLSTLSSGLNSLAALTVEDFIKPFVKNLSDFRATVFAKVSVAAYGVIIIALSFVIANIEGPLTQISSCLLASFSGAVDGTILLAVFCPRCNTKGLIIGSLVGAGFVAWISIGQLLSTTRYKEYPLPLGTTESCPSSIIMTNSSTQWFNQSLKYQTANMTSTVVFDENESYGLDQLYSLSFMLFAFISILITVVVGYIVTLLTGPKKLEDVDVKYVLPFLDQFLPCLPYKLRKLFYFGVKFEKRSQAVSTNSFDERNWAESTSQPNAPSEPSNTASLTDKQSVSVF